MRQRLPLSEQALFASLSVFLFYFIFSSRGRWIVGCEWSNVLACVFDSVLFGSLGLSGEDAPETAFS